MTDRLSPELREIERQVDDAFRTNPLVGSPFATSAWSLLTAVDNRATLANLSEWATHEAFNRTDWMIRGLAWSLGWIRDAAATGGEIPTTLDLAAAEHAIDLQDLAIQYDRFVTTFTLASAGEIGIKLENDVLVPVHSYLDDTRYEAYNALVNPPFSDEDVGFQDLADFVSRRTKLSRDRMSIDINERLMEHAVDTARRASRFEMPGHWQFSRYSLAEFKQAYAIPFALAAIQFFARRRTVKVRGPASGASDSLSIITLRSLRRLVSRYSHAPAATAVAVLEDLTYGARGMDRPDPALQPLVVLRNDMVAIMPQLWLHRSVERNLLTLLNRIPDERSIYLRLVDEKEDLMRDALMEKAEGLHLRTWHGQVPNGNGLPDIDLALIDVGRRYV